ncbi:hypothetical protein DV735_g5927, partial [Chaetothyriales sp. CBS 134920]
MSTSTFEYGYIEGVEWLEDYRPGGYHPIQIDDCLRDRYRVIHKLGHGAFSTAWLALDEQTSKYVAIKVGTAEADRREAEILAQLTTSGAAGSVAKDKAFMIPRALDHFSLLDVARSLAAQLVVAVSFVHSQGYAHGDLHLGNLLLQMPSSFNDLSIEQFYAKFGAPALQPIVRLDGKPTSSVSGVPSHVVPPVRLAIPSNEITLSQAKLLLVDFGVSFRPSDKDRFESYSPLILRPPEVVFEPTSPLSFASDIWTLGCVIFELLAHRSLIDGILVPPSEITAQQIYLQGPLPPDWWDRYEDRFKWFDEAQKPTSKECDIWSWDRCFQDSIQDARRHYGMEVLNDNEAVAFLDMLRWMLAWKPKDRPTADQVLDTVWMKRWALPAYDQTQKAWA